MSAMIMYLLYLIICVHLVLVQIECESISRDSGNSILRYINEPYNGADGGYSFEYETMDRQIRKEEGKFGATADGQLVLRVTGYYRYVGPDGIKRLIEYESDENGYRQNITIVKPGNKRISPNAVKSLIG